MTNFTITFSIFTKGTFYKLKISTLSSIIHFIITITNFLISFQFCFTFKLLWFINHILCWAIFSNNQIKTYLSILFNSKKWSCRKTSILSKYFFLFNLMLLCNSDRLTSCTKPTTIKLHYPIFSSTTKTLR